MENCLVFYTLLVLNGNETFNGYCLVGGLDFIQHDLKKVLVDDGFDEYEFPDDTHCKKKEMVRVCITHAIFKVLK